MRPFLNALAYPDIFQRILSYADDPTLATMLRVNQYAQDMAALFLYRNISVDWTEKRHPFVRAFVPIGGASTRSMKAASRVKHRMLKNTDTVIINDVNYVGLCKVIGDRNPFRNWFIGQIPPSSVYR